MPSRREIDQLGERIRDGATGEVIATELFEFRRSLDHAYRFTEEILRQLGYQPTGRPQKTPASIRAKLSRQRYLQLSRIQDIAGCRIVVANVHAQDEAVETLQKALPHDRLRIVDRRAAPSNGYRAVHAIVTGSDGKRVEVQIRTVIQHRWAEWSEKIDDQFFRGAKYGNAPAAVLQHMQTASAKVEQIESTQRSLRAAQSRSGQTYEELFELSRREIYVSMDEGLFHDLTDNIVQMPIEWRR